MSFDLLAVLAPPFTVGESDTTSYPTNIWLGGAEAVQHQRSYALYGCSIGTTWTARRHGKSVSYVSRDTVATNTATGLASLWNASTETPHTEVTATVSGGSLIFTADTAGQPLDDLEITASGVVLTPTSEVQSITVSPSVVAGTFRMTFAHDGESATTASIAYSATASVVQTQLAALSTIGAGNVLVTGSAGGPWTVTFTGDLAGQPVDALSSGSTLAAQAEVLVEQTKYGGIGTNCVKKIAIPAAPFTGSYHLVFDEEVSDWIEWNASPAEVQTAMEAMSSIGSGGVGVTGTTGSEYYVTFEGELGAQPIGLLAASSDVSGHPEITVAVDEPGEPGADCVQIITLPTGTTAPTAGTYVLTFDGYTSDPLDISATATEVQAALEAITSIGIGNIVVSGPTAGAFTLTFAGDLVQSERAEIVGNAYWQVPYAIQCTTEVAGVAGVNEVQRLFIANANYGTYTLTFGEETTTELQWNASASTVRTSLRALSTIGDGNMSVTNPNSGVYYLTFISELSSGARGMIEVASNDLEWRTPLTVTVSQEGAAGAYCAVDVYVDWYMTFVGYWEMTVDGQTTDKLYFNTDVQAAIEALSTVGQGNVTVTVTPDGAPGVGATYHIVFAQQRPYAYSFEFGFMDPGQTVYSTPITDGQFPAHDVQRITRTGGVDGGTFTLTYDGETTGSLAWNASGDGAVQTALEGLSTIGTGNVVVSGDLVNATYYTVTFQEYADKITLSVDPHLTYSGTNIICATSRLAGGSPGTDAVQYLRHITEPIGGTFTLEFGTSTSAELNWNASAAEVQFALQSLASIGAGNVLVTGAADSGWWLTFTGAYHSKSLATVDTNPEWLRYSNPAITTAVEEEGSPGYNCVQTLSTASTTVTAGSYTITFDGYTTADIAYSATAATVRTALENLIVIGGGNVTVTGGPIGTASFVVTFVDDLANAEQAEMSVTSELVAIGPLDITTLVDGTAGTNTRQQIGYHMGQYISEGTWVLRFNPDDIEGMGGVTLPLHCTLDELEAALNSLPTIKPGDVAVSLPETGGDAHVIEFKNRYAAQDVPLVTAEGHLISTRHEIPANIITTDASGQPGEYALTIKNGAGWVWLERNKFYARTSTNIGGWFQTGASDYQIKHIFKRALEEGESFRNELRYYWADVHVTHEEIPRGTVYHASIPAYEAIVDVDAINALEDNMFDYAPTPMSTRQTFYDKGLPSMECGGKEGDGEGAFRNVISASYSRVRTGHGDLNQQQMLTIYETASGSFTLTFGGETTPAMSVDFTYAEIQSALEGLESIGAGNVVVTPTSGLATAQEGQAGYGTYKQRTALIEFTGTMAVTNHALITAAFSGTPQSVPIPIYVLQGPGWVGQDAKGAVVEVTIRIPPGISDNEVFGYLKVMHCGTGVPITASTTGAQINARLQEMVTLGIASTQVGDVEFEDMPKVYLTGQVDDMPGQYALKYRVYFVRTNIGVEIGSWWAPAANEFILTGLHDYSGLSVQVLQTGYPGMVAEVPVWFGGLNETRASLGVNVAELAKYSADQLDVRYPLTAGTWTLSFYDTQGDGTSIPYTERTVIFDWSDTATVIEQKLEELASVTLGSVTVTGDAMLPPIEFTDDDAIWIKFDGWGAKATYKQIYPRSYMPMPERSPCIGVELFRSGAPACNTHDGFTVRGYVDSGYLWYAVAGDHLHKTIMLTWPIDAGALQWFLERYYGVGNVVVEASSSNDRYGYSNSWEIYYSGWYAGKAPTLSSITYSLKGPKPTITVTKSQELVRGCPLQQAIQFPLGDALSRQPATTSAFLLTFANAIDAGWGTITIAGNNDFTQAHSIGRNTTAAELNARFWYWATFTDIDVSNTSKTWHVKINATDYAAGSNYPWGWEDWIRWDPATDNSTFTGTTLELGSPSDMIPFNGGTFTLTFDGETAQPMPLALVAYNGDGNGSIVELCRRIQESLESIPALKDKVWVYPGAITATGYMRFRLGAPMRAWVSPDAYGIQIVIRFLGDMTYEDGTEPVQIDYYIEDATAAPYICYLEHGRPRENAQQVLTCNSTSTTAGTWSLTHNGITVTGLSYSCTADELQAQLDAEHGEGNIIASEGPFPTTPIQIDFDGAYSYDYQDAVETVSTLQTMLANAVTVAEDTAGDWGTFADGIDLTANEGPNCWSTADNWSLARVPQTMDAVVFAGGSVPMLFGYPTDGTLHLSSFTMEPDYGGQFGPLDAITAPPSFAANQWYLASGGDWTRIDVSASVPDQVVTVLGAGTPTTAIADTRALEITGGNSTSILVIRKGIVGVATQPGAVSEWASLAALHSGSTKKDYDVDLLIGAGATVPAIYQAGARVVSHAPIASWTQYAGYAYNVRGAVSSLAVIGGVFYLNTGGYTMESFAIGEDGNVDASQGFGDIVTTTHAYTAGYVLVDPMGRITQA